MWGYEESALTEMKKAIDTKNDNIMKRNLIKYCIAFLGLSKFRGS